MEVFCEGHKYIVGLYILVPCVIKVLLVFVWKADITEVGNLFATSAITLNYSETPSSITNSI